MDYDEIEGASLVSLGTDRVSRGTMRGYKKKKHLVVPKKKEVPKLGEFVVSFLAFLGQ